MQRGVHTLQLVTPCYFSLHPFRRGVGNPSLPLLTHPHPWTPPTPTAALSYSPRLYAMTPSGPSDAGAHLRTCPEGGSPLFQTVSLHFSALPGSEKHKRATAVGPGTQNHALTSTHGAGERGCQDPPSLHHTSSQSQRSQVSIVK